MHVDRPRVDIGGFSIAPYLLEEKFAAQDLAARLHQFSEKLELLGGELDGLAVDRCRGALEIDLDRSRSERSHGRGGDAPPIELDIFFVHKKNPQADRTGPSRPTSEPLRDSTRNMRRSHRGIEVGQKALFQDKTVGPALGCRSAVRLLVVSRENDDFYVGTPGLDPSGRLDAVQFGHVDVHEDHLRLELALEPESFLAVFSFADQAEVYFFFGYALDGLAKTRVVID